MSITATAKLMTADELLRLPSGEFRYELLDGVLHTMSPAGASHGYVANKIGYLLTDYVERHQLGAIFGAETGFILRRNPDTVRAPDSSFVSIETLRRVGLPAKGFFVGAPELAVEVLSPDDRPGNIKEKLADWFNGGVHCVWLVDPRVFTITVYSSPDESCVLTVADVLNGAPVLPGFQCPVKTVFARPV